MKSKKMIFIPILAVLCVVLYAFFARPAIETHTWVLFSAQRADLPYFVAHQPGYDPSDTDQLFAFSKETELTCVAKDGKLTITDKTNHKTYEGTYKAASWGRFRQYDVVIDGKEGTANISSEPNRTLVVSIGDYFLNFEAE